MWEPTLGTTVNDISENSIVRTKFGAGEGTAVPTAAANIKDISGKTEAIGKGSGNSCGSFRGRGERSESGIQMYHNNNRRSNKKPQSKSRELRHRGKYITDDVGGWAGGAVKVGNGGGSCGGSRQKRPRRGRQRRRNRRRLRCIYVCICRLQLGYRNKRTNYDENPAAPHRL